MPVVRLDIVDMEFSRHLGCEFREIHPRELGIAIPVGRTLNKSAKRIRGNRDSVTRRSREGNMRLRCECGPYRVRTSGDQSTSGRQRKLLEENTPGLHGKTPQLRTGLYSLETHPSKTGKNGLLPFARLCPIATQLLFRNERQLLIVRAPVRMVRRVRIEAHKLCSGAPRIRCAGRLREGGTRGEIHVEFFRKML